MTTTPTATRAAVSAADAKRLRLAALLDLARKHDDDVNYAEVELLLAASHPRLALHETQHPERQPRPHGDERRRS